MVEESTPKSIPDPPSPATQQLLSKILDEWTVSSDHFSNVVERQQHDYVTKLTEVQKIQAVCLKNVKAERDALKNFQEKLHKIDAFSLAAENATKFQDLVTEMAERKNRLHDMTESLPRQSSGPYLNVILGSIDVSILNKADKFRYKDDYEKFKITVTVVSIIFAFLAYVFQSRVLDALYHFLLVWYYCTLTIRESILRINGSRIKGWWVFHHYASTVLCGILLTWPDGECYQQFRKQFIVFSFYIGVVQLLQSQYQRGCLYRLRALGMSHSMDITVDGFHSWMFRGLTFLLPFLFLGYLLQLYNFYTLLRLFWTHESAEWQVLALSLLFLLLSLGNTTTTAMVCLNKMREKSAVGHRQRLTTKYQLESEGEGDEKRSKEE